MKAGYLTLLAAALLIPAGSALAQKIEKGVGYGYIPMQATFKVTDMYDLSKFNANMGTARSAAMGGAFASLGADLSSMNINPAGLGMYRTSEFGATASVAITNMKGSFSGLRGTADDTRTTFGLNNVGAVFNVFQGSGPLTSFTFGIGYNKLADHNYSSPLYTGEGRETSINDMFMHQVAGYVAREGAAGLDTSAPWKNDIERGGAWLDEWGAILAYKSGMVQQKGTTDAYYLPGLSDNALSEQYLKTLSKGSTREYTLSGGWNFRNRFYMGFSLGYIDIYQDREVTFDEKYLDNVPTDGPAADNMSYYQRVRTNGEGVNFKFGMTVRTDMGIRVGVAVHTPTVVTLENDYYSDMAVRYGSGARDGFANTPNELFTEKYYSPARLIAGLSYTYTDRAIFAADYEWTWYNGMRVRDNEVYYKEDMDILNNGIKDNFRTGGSLRLGTEIRATDDLMVRAGWVYNFNQLSTPLKDGERFTDAPVESSSMSGSLGIGLRLTARTSLDFAYIFSEAKYTKYDIYLYQPAEGDYTIDLRGASLKHNRHNLTLSLNCRF